MEINEPAKKIGYCLKLLSRKLIRYTQKLNVNPKFFGSINSPAFSFQSIYSCVGVCVLHFFSTIVPHFKMIFRFDANLPQNYQNELFALNKMNVYISVRVYGIFEEKWIQLCWKQCQIFVHTEKEWKSTKIIRSQSILLEMFAIFQPYFYELFYHKMHFFKQLMMSFYQWFIQLWHVKWFIFLKHCFKYNVLTRAKERVRDRARAREQNFPIL